MNHYTHVPSRRRAGPNLPWLLCEDHFLALAAEDQARYLACIRRRPDCGALPQDCLRCEVEAFGAELD